MNILNNVKNLNILVVLAISLMVFSNCQNENAVLEENNNLKLNENLRIFSKPKKSKKILEDNVNGRLPFRHDEIYNYTYDPISNRCTTAQLSKIIFGVETILETSSFSFNSNGTIEITTGIRGGRLPSTYSIKFNPRTNFVSSISSSNVDASPKNISFSYSSTNTLTKIVETNGTSGGPGRGPTAAAGEIYTYSNFSYDFGKNLTQYKLVITAPSPTLPGVTYKKIEEIVNIYYFSTANIGSDLSPFPRMDNLNAMDLVKINNLTYGVQGNKMISSMVSKIKYFDSNGSGAFKSNTLKTTVTRNSANQMTKANRTNLSFPASFYTSDEVYLVEYEY
ncbi:MAG: hypothetical protein IPF63_01625 [Bacteroidetes bacterium]|nr:hypothetical protein [Bacteroidota bacterium]